MIWIPSVIGHVLAIVGGYFFIRSFIVGGGILNKVPSSQAARYMLYGNLWIWRTPDVPPDFLSEEVVSLERQRRTLILRGLVAWLAATPFYIVASLLS